MTAGKGQGHEGGGAGRPAGEALPGLPTRAGIGLSGAPDGDLAPPKSRTHHPAQAGPHLPTDRPTDRETLRGRGGGGGGMRAWETKSCPTTGTLHGHASGPGAPFPATPGSRGPAGYHPPSPDPSGLGKKMFPRRRLRRTDPAKEGAGARATLSAPPLTSCAGLDLVSTTPHGPAVAISRGAGGEGPMPA